MKVVRPDIAGDPRKVERFLQEARVAQKLCHPNIARMVGYESVGRSAMIAMEYICGQSLAQIVHQRGPLPVGEAREHVRQAATGLEYAARHGVVHRDIKPQNLMLDAGTKLVKVVDFGLGRLVEEQRSGSRLTREGEILGTLDYISPEQAADSRNADIRSDIYSLGCTFYFLLAGAPPFSGKNAIELLRMHETEPPVPIRTLRPDVPNEIVRLLEAMMHKDPAARPQTPHHVVTAIANRPSARTVRMATARATAAGGAAFDKIAVVRALASPVVWLPIFTGLVCLMWRLIR